MPSITCPACKAVLNSNTPVPAGKNVKCPKCGVSFTTGEPSAAKAQTEQPKKKPNLMLIGGVAGGVLLLSCCCVGLVGGGGWWWFSSKGIKSAIVGVWRTP